MFSSVMIVESRWRFFRKTRSAGYAGLYRLAILIAAIVRIGIMLAFWSILMIYGKTSVVDSSRKKWIAILHWAIGRASWVKEQEYANTDLSL
jgi:hypothetical protein